MFAEVWTVRQGLQLAWDKGFKRVIIEVDSTEALRMIEAGVNEEHYLANLLVHAPYMRSRNWEYRFRHTYHEANQYANFLAKMGPTDSSKASCWNLPPPRPCDLLFADSIGFSCKSRVQISYWCLFFLSCFVTCCLRSFAPKKEEFYEHLIQSRHYYRNWTGRFD